MYRRLFRRRVRHHWWLNRAKFQHLLRRRNGFRSLTAASVAGRGLPAAYPVSTAAGPGRHGKVHLVYRRHGMSQQHNKSRRFISSLLLCSHPTCGGGSQKCFEVLPAHPRKPTRKTNVKTLLPGSRGHLYRSLGGGTARRQKSPPSQRTP